MEFTWLLKDKDQPSFQSIPPLELNVPCKIPPDPAPGLFPFTVTEYVETQIREPSLTIASMLPLTNAGNSNSVFNPVELSVST